MTIGRTESIDESRSWANQHILVQLIRAAVPVTDLALMACQSHRWRASPSTRRAMSSRTSLMRAMPSMPRSKGSSVSQ